MLAPPPCFAALVGRDFISLPPYGDVRGAAAAPPPPPFPLPSPAPPRRGGWAERPAARRPPGGFYRRGSAPPRRRSSDGDPSPSETLGRQEEWARTEVRHAEEWGCRQATTSLRRAVAATTAARRLHVGMEWNI
eukprot:gene12231-6128_t